MGFQDTFKAFSDPTRREILDLLKSGPKAAGDISSHFKMTGATISHHLSTLKDSGLISDRKEGKYIYYELNMTVIDEILNWFTAFKSHNEEDKK